MTTLRILLRRTAAFALAGATLGLGATAEAQTTEADALFARGRTLLEKGQFAEACPQLERSERLAPAVGTLLNLGYCWEQLGRMRSAMESYSEAEILARTGGDAKRAAFAKERLAAVEPRAMKLVVRVIAPVAEMDVRRNDAPVPKTDWNQPIPVDPDDFVITAAAPGHAPWKTVVAARGDGTVVTVFVPPLDPLSPPLGVQRIAALGLGGIAAASFGAAIAVLATPSQKASTESALALFGFGALGAGAGAYLWFASGSTSKHAAAERAVRLELRPLGAAFTGRF